MREQIQFLHLHDGARTLQQISFLKLHDGARLPAYATAGAGGMDLASPDWHLIDPGAQRLVGLGFSAAIPAGYGMFLFSRSGHAKLRVSLSNSVGLVDSDYRGEVGVFLRNDGPLPLEIKPGDRIAQAVVMPIDQFAPVWVAALPAAESTRDGGWGSTGTESQPKENPT
jgi:dUTP pyrophosphatase